MRQFQISVAKKSTLNHHFIAQLNLNEIQKFVEDFNINKNTLSELNKKIVLNMQQQQQQQQQPQQNSNNIEFESIELNNFEILNQKTSKKFLMNSILTKNLK